MAWNWHALTTSPGDLFDANVFYPGATSWPYRILLGRMLLVWPVYALTGNVLLADNLSFFIALIFSAVAMYLLVVDITGNRLAGILPGAAFASRRPAWLTSSISTSCRSPGLPLSLLWLAEGEDLGSGAAGAGGRPG
ncbi:MAG: hypothetical protein R3A46_14205 [Thermomicrobiales bacterium]